MRSPIELLSAHVPRYTSYPTAPHFGGKVTAETYRNWLREVPDSAPLSLYLHIPFCDTLCWFCGCHTKVINNYGPVAAYLDLLLREIDLVADLVGEQRPVSHIHWGGGSPTMLSPADIDRLMAKIRARFLVQPDAEFAVEVDPRGLSNETIAALAAAGVNRVSIGVQDIDKDVQKAINRIQPFSVTADACTRFRNAGINAINIDLIYGLPYQTSEMLAQTITSCLSLNADRFAIFGYAHVPHFKKHQALIPVESLPGPQERFTQFHLAQRLLNEAGYRSIGLDHFAKPQDTLAQAEQKGVLHRNFQGYTTDTSSILTGMGLSSISAMPQGYAQNETDYAAYRDAILASKLPVTRGIALSRDDSLRAAVIEQLMCNFRVDLAELTSQFGVARDYFAGELSDLMPLAEDGFVAIDDNKITVPEQWRVAIRLVCAAFDSYLTKSSMHAIAV